MNVLSALGEALVLIGTFFYFLSALGLIRMPDVYNRMQTSTKSATLGSLGVMVGVGLWAVGDGLSWSWFTKSVVIALFLLLTNPISAHALIRAAYKSGIPLWQGSVVDKYREHLEAKEKAETEASKEGGEE
ncbi:membrane bound hydrogenase, MbxC subunit [Thermococcus kodakarensis KOD1]|uniref:Membrane bound hydrogenase, MbxC subunit n=1 Tax=Thermococcus kodakarensis (strain ATCC BAA-918 / JCM 12380 / KOD1) TaxID=69014 RepID=Q5JGI8_THEKO|nr:monovalent cation/H(+) antiporter subunit G [Thermococcus kodakarensis]WCN27232.1 monovalent cation/H(+) antiporter subunit G [Thermococcus kodakarensis]WCN29518.1 monovalent cation/H(+) antiporter subunit G [Thermococcus kodakarensis]BAD85413.1 membrane bound hydrogenase, MbxC subunit [Thermococcus kodakarensis KOD1]